MMSKVVKFKTPYGDRTRSGFETTGDSMTQQSHAAAADVRNRAKGEGFPEQYINPETGEVEYDLDNQYATMSRGNKNQPENGIGNQWYWKYGWTDAHCHDYIIHDNIKMKVPRYYDKELQKYDPEYFEQLKAKRKEQAPEAIIEYNKAMDDLWVSEEIKIKKLERLVRNL